MRITAQWFGGPSYAAPDGSEVEHFDSIDAAKAALFSRSSGDPFRPCVENSEMLLWIGTLDDVTDVYPDRRLFFGPRGGIRCELC